MMRKSQFAARVYVRERLALIDAPTSTFIIKPFDYEETTISFLDTDVEKEKWSFEHRVIVNIKYTS